MRQRHAYGATDNIVLDVRARDRAGHEWMMGDALEAVTAPALDVNVLGTSVIESIDVIKDGKFVFQAQPGAEAAEF